MGVEVFLKGRKRGRVATEGDAFLEEGLGDGGEGGGECGCVDEELLRGVAASRVGCLCVDDDFDGFVDGVIVTEVGGADSIGMAEDGDGG